MLLSTRIYYLIMLKLLLIIKGEKKFDLVLIQKFKKMPLVKK